MSFREKIARWIERLGDHPLRRKTAQPTQAREFMEKSRLIAALIFTATAAAIVLISYVGMNTANLPVLPNQTATVRVVASAAFDYESQEKTLQLREQLLDRVPPVYRLDFTAHEKFQTATRELLAGLIKVEKDFPPEPAATPVTPAITARNVGRRAALAAITDAFNARGPYRATTDDVAILLRSGNAAERESLLELGLSALREIYNEGVQDGMLGRTAPGNVTVFQIERDNGEISSRPVQTMEEALTFLRVNLINDGSARETSLAFFRFLRNGLAPNLVFDEPETVRRQAEAASQIRTAVVSVARGQTIIEPGTRVTPEQYEMFRAHRQWLLDHGGLKIDEGLQLFGRILLVLAMVMASAVYIRLEDNETIQSNGRLALLASVVILNLAVIRLVYQIGGIEFFLREGTWGAVLPYIAPTAFAPLIVAILIDMGSAIFMALLISIFTGVIYGNRLDLIVLTFLASMVAIFGCRAIRRRSDIVRAASAGGLTVAVFALLIGIAEQVPFATLAQQMGAGLISGMLTGIAVVGLLPVLESLFKRTTDITLLELTDYNHPLLRLMQLEAPGSYHHSLVVAQLSENAASAIGANPLLSRVCALFHDIGKTSKPEYFTENQRDRVNPHDENNPSLSALIIKSHVKDGVDLAIKHNLPRAVIDVIQQHHGTSLIRYFFQRAIKSTRAQVREPGTAPGLDPEKISESTYRYDGPRPRFRESAIISLADGVEAASRSMRKVTSQNLSELIDTIYRDRIDDGQLDECPLTIKEMAVIKESFTYTLLNMLHGRVAYPGPDEPVAPALPAPRK